MSTPEGKEGESEEQEEKEEYPAVYRYRWLAPVQLAVKPHGVTCNFSRIAFICNGKKKISTWIQKNLQNNMCAAKTLIRLESAQSNLRLWCL